MDIIMKKFKKKLINFLTMKKMMFQIKNQMKKLQEK